MWPNTTNKIKDKKQGTAFRERERVKVRHRERHKYGINPTPRNISKLINLKKKKKNYYKSNNSVL